MRRFPEWNTEYVAINLGMAVGGILLSSILFFANASQRTPDRMLGVGSAIFVSLLLIIAAVTPFFCTRPQWRTAIQAQWFATMVMLWFFISAMQRPDFPDIIKAFLFVLTVITCVTAICLQRFEQAGSSPNGNINYNVKSDNDR